MRIIDSSKRRDILLISIGRLRAIRETLVETNVELGLVGFNNELLNELRNANESIYSAINATKKEV